MPKGAKWSKYTKTLSGNSLKGSNIQHKKKKNPCGREKGCGQGKIMRAGKKDAGGDEKLAIFSLFTWPKGPYNFHSMTFYGFSKFFPVYVADGRRCTHFLQ
jgi:hypothetical protein